MAEDPTSPEFPIGAIAVMCFFLMAGIAISYLYVDYSLNRMGASATAIGVNAAMPALGWLVATPFLPLLLRRFTPVPIMLVLLAIAMSAMILFPLLPDQIAWMFLRCLFGGCTGMVLRLVEYWINAGSRRECRARNIGIYASVGCSGAAVGAAVLSLVGTQGWPPILLILGFLGMGVVLSRLIRSPPPHAPETPMPLNIPRGAALTAVAGGLVFGLFEGVPYSLMPVYLVRAGMAESWATWSVSAFLIGEILFPIPLGILADRIQKSWILVGCILAAAGVALTIPVMPSDQYLMLVAMVVWGGCVGSIYNIALAMLADAVGDGCMVAANASFGTLYAAGSLVGPLVHGSAMQASPIYGLMISATLLFGIYLLIVVIRGSMSRYGSA
jgi:MFS family permease